MIDNPEAFAAMQKCFLDMVTTRLRNAECSVLPAKSGPPRVTIHFDEVDYDLCSTGELDADALNSAYATILAYVEEHGEIMALLRSGYQFADALIQRTPEDTSLQNLNLRLAISAYKEHVMRLKSAPYQDVQP
jgi:hypothetical protein